MTSTLDEYIALKESGKLPQNVNYAVKSSYVWPMIQSKIQDALLKETNNQKIDIPDLIEASQNGVALVIAK